MKKSAMIFAAAATIAVAGCTQEQMGGAAIGAGTGFIAAKALDANSEWTVLGTLAGAAAGSMVAQHQNGSQCAYARGDGTYYTAPCPS